MSISKHIKVLLCLLSLSSTSVYAETESVSGAERGVYVVNVSEVVQNSVAGKAARNNVEAAARAKEAQLQKIKVEMDKLQSDIQKQTSLLSPDALESRKELLAKKQREMERVFQDQREDLIRKNDAEVSKVMQQVEMILSELATKKNYAFIIEKDPRFVVFASSRLDLTAEVIRLLDSKVVNF